MKASSTSVVNLFKISHVAWEKLKVAIQTGAGRKAYGKNLMPYAFGLMPVCIS